eukprot:TRINITY_DN6615_c0_g1_i2.p1 TRINITY_DN6615_c0_g1~~TRINITY_DN6615_c0_g1_i2.p1  ORF type:complete len:117 (-),score=24.34 TRINITY_DN6615_c0_g1_i2:42-392(-)
MEGREEGASGEVPARVLQLHRAVEGNGLSGHEYLNHMLEIAEAEDVRELIRYGFVGVEDRWPGDISLLHKAVQSKQRALVRMLLISGADVFATTSIVRTRTHTHHRYIYRYTNTHL